MSSYPIPEEQFRENLRNKVQIIGMSEETRLIIPTVSTYLLLNRFFYPVIADEIANIYFEAKNNLEYQMNLIYLINDTIQREKFRYLSESKVDAFAEVLEKLLLDAAGTRNQFQYNNALHVIQTLHERQIFNDIFCSRIEQYMKYKFETGESDEIQATDQYQHLINKVIDTSRNKEQIISKAKLNLSEPDQNELSEAISSEIKARQDLTGFYTQQLTTQMDKIRILNKDLQSQNSTSKILDLFDSDSDE